MKLKELEFGVGKLLRERVDGWAQSDSGIPHVYPDHPPLTLSRSSYPRATIDVTGQTQQGRDIEGTAFFGDLLLQITVYAGNSSEVVELVGDSIEKVVTHQDDTIQSGDRQGEPYLENHSVINLGVVDPILTDRAEKGFTRFNKTAEIEFEYTLVT